MEYIKYIRVFLGVLYLNKFNLKKTCLQNILMNSPVGSEVIQNAAYILIRGNNSIHIENYKKILEYSSCKIILCDRYKNIIILGDNLFIKYFFDGELDIVGRIN
jgi:sporulation protein YqfC